jgi:lysophospholipase L1-like esterase
MRPTLARAALLLLLLPLVACSDDPEAEPAGPAEAPAATSSSTAPEPRPSYVALGDSYTAAPLISDEAATDGCLRSPTNYPRLVADELGYDLVDVSCAGATTENLRTAQATSTSEAPPQLDAVTADTALVTIGIGGNDGAVFSRLIGCAANGVGTVACGADLEAAIDDVGGHLTEAIAAVRERAPEAEVVVVGYPQIIAPDASCPDRLPIRAEDAPALAALNERLHTVQEAAAAAADTPYADLFEASRGHDVCSDDPWVNGQQTTPGVGLALHPLAAGQVAAAELVVEALG